MKLTQQIKVMFSTPVGSTSWKSSFPRHMFAVARDDVQVHPLVINPKSVTLSELYGAYDLATFEWADGILSTLFKQSAESDKPDEKVNNSNVPALGASHGKLCHRVYRKNQREGRCFQHPPLG